MTKKMKMKMKRFEPSSLELIVELLYTTIPQSIVNTTKYDHRKTISLYILKARQNDKLRVLNTLGTDNHVKVQTHIYISCHNARHFNRPSFN